jgi:hypothetical protein
VKGVGDDIEFVDSALLSSSEKPSFCRQSDKTPFTCNTVRGGLLLLIKWGVKVM